MDDFNNFTTQVEVDDLRYCRQFFKWANRRENKSIIMNSDRAVLNSDLGGNVFQVLMPFFFQHTGLSNHSP